MNSVNLESLGFTVEELQARVVNNLVDRLLSGHTFGEGSPVHRQFQNVIKTAIDVKLDTLFETQILPHISSQVDELIIQKTNEWGEKKGAPVTFLEYLVERADLFINEPVDSRGRTRAQCAASHDSFSEVRGSNRLINAVETKLNSHLQACVQAVVKDATDKVGVAMGDLLKTTLKNAQDNIKVNITRQ